MRLRLIVTDDSLRLSRDKGCVLGVHLVLGIFCIAFPIGFYALVGELQTGWSHGLLAAFCLFFFAAGMALLVKLPGQWRQLLLDDGLTLLLADASGITYTRSFGAPILYRPWRDVVELALVEKLNLIDSDEKTSASCVLLVFLSAAASPDDSWSMRLQSGVAYSGRERPYWSEGYPRGRAQETWSALRQFAPETVPVNFYESAVFDRKRREDRFKTVELEQPNS